MRFAGTRQHKHTNRFKNARRSLKWPISQQFQPNKIFILTIFFSSPFANSASLVPNHNFSFKLQLASGSPCYRNVIDRCSTYHSKEVWGQVAKRCNQNRIC